jgi:hypothetical protein
VHVGQSPPPTDLEDVLSSLAEVGDVERAAVAKGTWSWRTAGLGLPSGTSAAILDGVREDR